MAEKRCARCGHTKPLAEFHRQTRSPDGHGGYCKPCNAQNRREWAATHREHVRSYARWRARWLNGKAELEDRPTLSACPDRAPT